MGLTLLSFKSMAKPSSDFSGRENMSKGSKSLINLGSSYSQNHIHTCTWRQICPSVWLISTELLCIWSLITHWCQDLVWLFQTKWELKSSTLQSWTPSLNNWESGSYMKLIRIKSHVWFKQLPMRTLLEPPVKTFIVNQTHSDLRAPSFELK